MVTIAGNLNDIMGAAELGSSLVVQLCSFGNSVPRVIGTAVLAKTAPLPVLCPAGTYNFQLYGNDVITPAGTYYTIQVLDDNGNVVQTNAYQFTGANVYDLSSAAPYNPPPPATIPANPVLLNPAGVQTIAGGIIIQGNLVVTGTITNGGLVVVPFAANPAFNAAVGNAFEITLTGNVVGPTLVGTYAGQIVTFIVIQDAVGGRTFAWPANVINAQAIDATPNAINIQSFIARANGNLYPIGPLTVN